MFVPRRSSSAQPLPRRKLEQRGNVPAAASQDGAVTSAKVADAVVDDSGEWPCCRAVRAVHVACPVYTPAYGARVRVLLAREHVTVSPPQRSAQQPRTNWRRSLMPDEHLNDVHITGSLQVDGYVARA